MSGDIYPAEILSKIAQDSKKGSKVIHVESSDRINAGVFIVIAMYNTNDAGNLMHDIMFPWKTFQPSMKTAIDAGPDGAASYQWLVEVESVSKQTIHLKQPCRMAISTKYSPVVASAPMLTGIGVENITFNSKWDRNYCHHGCESSSNAEGRIMDYGWNAIQFVRVAHG